MKNQFPQFSTLSDDDYKQVWQEGLFVFDTNVLLSIYRYQPEAREQLLEVLTELANRVWIPHQVALEFYRNRLSIIGEQIKRYNDVRKVVDESHQSLVKGLDKLELKKRHSLINPEKLLSGVEKVVNEFHAMLDELRSSQQTLTGPDPIRDRLEALFENKVGSAISNQAELDKLYKEAEERFKLEVPPGYMDDDKERKARAEYKSGGLTHKRKYGDYVIWTQLLEHVKASRMSSVIFITDDNKEDWWQKLDVNGPQTIGPRPELIEEAKLSAGIDKFLMYNSENFLKFARQFLKAEVSVETINEVREVAAVHLPDYDFISRQLRTIQAVVSWLGPNYGAIEYPANGLTDFIANAGTKTIGFDVKVVHGSLPPLALATMLNQLISTALSLELNEINAVLIFANSEEANKIKLGFLSLSIASTAVPVWITTGFYDDEMRLFKPYDRFNPSRGSSLAGN
jgi:hypothetical protein